MTVEADSVVAKDGMRHAAAYWTDAGFTKTLCALRIRRKPTPATPDKPLTCLECIANLGDFDAVPLAASPLTEEVFADAVKAISTALAVPAKYLFPPPKKSNE